MDTSTEAQSYKPPRNFKPLFRKESGLLGVDGFPQCIASMPSVPPSPALYLPGVGRDADNKDPFSAREKDALCKGRRKKLLSSSGSWDLHCPSSLQSDILSEGPLEIFSNHSPPLTRVRLRVKDTEQSKINSFQGNLTNWFSQTNFSTLSFNFLVGLRECLSLQ